ncbi:HEPN domain-containing protein [Bradyrhizobium sp. UNPF46]|uniref:HEPN domain-containing protein n=1 Tax=Bradyrhizobium sp. UNPF46 TaxID=1141168 RepID=UPI0015F002B1|nr:HEPN domain-containing protein [Bradyrhizobium sp. UNPF46]
MQVLSQNKLEDANILFLNKRYSGAYYLAGYSVELGLKACIAKLMLAEVIPDKAFVNAIYQHSFKPLVSIAGLSSDLKAKEDQDSVFAANWAVVTEWGPESRYDVKDTHSAQLLLNAIAEPNSGVFAWIKANW